MKINEQQVIEKYQQFMKIDILELEKNLEEFISPYKHGNSLFEKIDQYVEKLSLEEQKKYQQRRKSFEVHKKYYAQVVYQYLKGDKDDFSAFKYLNKEETKVALKRYLKAFPNYETEIHYARENVLRTPEIGFLDELKISLNRSDATYMKVLVPLLCCEKEEAICLLRGHRLSKNTFEFYLRSFQTRFPEYPQTIEYLRSLYEEYSKTILLPNKNLYNYNNSDNVLKNIYDSGMSIEEYCFCYGGSISKIKKIVKNRRNNEECTEILSRDTTNFIEKVKNIVEQIICGTIDYLDYYTTTKLELGFLLMMVKSFNLTKENYQKIYQFVTKGKNIENDNRIVESAQLEKLTKFGDREITKEEKIKIFDYLKENGIPLCYYNLALTKYVKGELNFGKQLEKR